MRHSPTAALKNSTWIIVISDLLPRVTHMGTEGTHSLKLGIAQDHLIFQEFYRLENSDNYS